MPSPTVKETAEYRVSNEKLKKTAEQEGKHLAQSSLGERGVDLLFFVQEYCDILEQGMSTYVCVAGITILRTLFKCCPCLHLLCLVSLLRVLISPSLPFPLPPLVAPPSAPSPLA